MNILYITQVESFQFGGTQVYNMASALASVGHNVKLMCKDRNVPGETVGAVGNGTLAIRKLGGHGRFRTLLHPFQLLFYGSRYITKNKIDIIYERNSTIAIGFLLSKIFCKPLVIAAQGVAYWECSSETRLRTVNSVELANRLIDNKLLASRFMMAIFKKMREINYKNAAWIITVSPQKKQMISALYGISPDKIIVSSNGADVERFQPMDIKIAKKLLKLDEDAQYVCFVGSLSFFEGVNNLINSAPLIVERCPYARFLIVGDGEIKEELIGLTKKNGTFDKFTFTGLVPYGDVPKYINASEVCVCPMPNDDVNRKAGASSLKNFEYMACGKPVVAGNIGDLGDLIAGSNAGLVFDVEVDSEFSSNMANAIIKLLEDKQLSQKLGQNGRDIVVEKYSWVSIARLVTEIFQEAINTKN